MAKVDRLLVNRVVTLGSYDGIKLDSIISQLLDIIDSYGGTNPYPRFFVTIDPDNEQGDFKYYSCTTKIGKENIESFDREILQLRVSLHN